MSDDLGVAANDWAADCDSLGMVESGVPVVIVVTFNSASDIAACLHALEGRSVIVVDNASSDATRAIVRAQFQGVRLLSLSRNVGLATAFNIGWREARGRDVLCLNPDVVVSSKGLDQLEAALHSMPTAGIVSPRLVNDDGSTQHSARSFPTVTGGLARRTPLGRTAWGQRQLSRHLLDVYPQTSQSRVAVDWVLGAAMLIRAEVLERADGFDERYFLYCEDVDICARAWRLGYQTIYCSDVAFQHGYRRQSRRTLNFTSRATRAHWRSILRLAKSYPAQYLGRALRVPPDIDLRDDDEPAVAIVERRGATPSLLE